MHYYHPLIKMVTIIDQIEGIGGPGKDSPI